MAKKYKNLTPAQEKAMRESKKREKSLFKKTYTEERGGAIVKQKSVILKNRPKAIRKTRNPK